MENLRRKRAAALKQVGISNSEVKEYLNSSREYYIQYRDGSSKLLTDAIWDKFRKLADVRRKMDIEIAGVIFEGDLSVTVIFYVDDNPEDAWFERNIFLSISDFVKELDRQSNRMFSPDMSEGKKIFYKKGMEIDFVLFK